MTREEAIKTLRELWRETNDPWYEEVYDMGIEALNSVTESVNDAVKTEDDVIKRQDAIKAVCRTRCGDKAKGCPAHSCPVIEEFEALPSAETSQNLAKPIKALKGSDLISRDVVLANIDERLRANGYGNVGLVSEFNRLIGYVRNIPSAEPKTGEWVLDQNGMDWNIPAWRCSECGFVANYIGVEANGLGNNPMNWAGSKFCPQCGARITGYER